MPKPVTVYECVCCGQHMANYDDCFNHEAVDHFHLTRDEYEEWRQLTEAYNQIRRLLHVTKSHMLCSAAPIEAQRDINKERLDALEEKHHLTNTDNPFLKNPWKEILL